jgi:hypothetical protein
VIGSRFVHHSEGYGRIAGWDATEPHDDNEILWSIMVALSNDNAIKINKFFLRVWSSALKLSGLGEARVPLSIQPGIAVTKIARQNDESLRMNRASNSTLTFASRFRG